MTPHRWQIDAVTAIDRILETDSYMYLQAPTGVGKTYAIILHGEQSSLNGTRVIIVGTDRITRQHSATLQDLGFKEITDDWLQYQSPNGHVWIVATWQSISRSPQRFFRPQGCAYLYFDECHVGGGNADNLSYKRIVAALEPAKRVMMSATANVSSQKLLGDRDEAHQWTYTMSAAYEDGLLNEVDIIEIEAGTRVQIEALESEFNKSIEQLEELSDNNLAKLAQRLSDSDVERITTKSDAAKQIVSHRHEVMMHIYLRDHKGQPAIFYCPNVDAAERAYTYFRRVTDTPATIAYADLGESARDRIEWFCNGGVSVIFVVGMLQEGFDMANLALAFDCRFHRTVNKYRIARIVQRVGRLTRKAPNKPVSRYYIAPDLTHYYSKQNIPDGSLLAAHLLAAADALDTDDRASVVRVMRAQDIKTDELPAKSTRLYAVKSVSEFATGQTFRLSDLPMARSWSEADTAVRKAEYIKMAEEGLLRPHWSDGGEWISNHATKDKEFAAALRKANPKWLRAPSTMTVHARKLWALGLDGYPDDEEGKQEWKRVVNYFQSGSTVYDAQFLAEMQKKSWFLGGAQNPGRPFDRTTLDRLLAHDEPPNSKDHRTDRDLLRRYLEIPKMAKIIREAKPYWFVETEGGRLIGSRRDRYRSKP